MKNYSIKRVTILRVEDTKKIKKEDIVIAEVPVQITLNGVELATILSSPMQIKELGAGFLFTEGFINSADDIIGFQEKNLSLYFEISPEKFSKEEKIQKYITSGCGRGVSFEIVKLSIASGKRPEVKPVSPDQIFKLMQVFQKKSELFLKTGGVHSAALCSSDNIIFFSEDIGRHNAVDKVVGHALLNKIKFSDKLILTSGRISSEIAKKVARIKVPILVSRSAPTDRGIFFANELGLTVIGFARGKKMNIYSHEERISVL